MVRISRVVFGPVALEDAIGVFFIVIFLFRGIFYLHNVGKQ